MSVGFSVGIVTAIVVEVRFVAVVVLDHGDRHKDLAGAALGDLVGFGLDFGASAFVGASVDDFGDCADHVVVDSLNSVTMAVSA